MTVRCLKAGPNAVAEAAAIVKRGGIVAVPTDTVYGLATDPWNDTAVKGLFEAKDRQAKPVPVLCSDITVAKRLVRLNDLAERLASAHWPGALTMVAPLQEGSGLSRSLDQGSGYLGVRVPDSEFCTALAKKSGGAITGTSANISGKKPCRSAAEVARSLDGRVGLVIDGGTLKGKESTVVKIEDTTIEVLREGSVRIQEGDLR
jgi:L-threonylcarbamoyladenylate synthase